jgi:hypothetical protein
VTGEALGETGREPLQRIGLADMGVVAAGGVAIPNPSRQVDTDHALCNRWRDRLATIGGALSPYLLPEIKS